MAIVGGEGEKANVTGKDLAAALAPERGRGPILNKEIATLKERYIKDAGKSVFEADLAQNPEDLMVNFDEMRRVLDSEGKRVDVEKDPKKKDVLKKRYDRLELRYNVYDKLLNNEGFSAMDGAEQQELINTMSALPGFAEAASVAIGGRLSTDQMMKVLSGKGGVAVTRDEKKALSEIIVSMANDDRFKNRVSKSLSALKLSDDDAKTIKEIDDLKYKIREKDEDQKKLDDAKKIKDDYEVANPIKEKREEIRTMYTDINNLINGLDAQYKPKNFSDTEFAGIKIRLQNLKTSAATILTLGAVGPGAAELSSRNQRANDQFDTFEQIESLAKGKSAIIKDYEKYTGSLSVIDEKEKALREYSKDEKDIVSKEAERGKYADKYKRQMEVALSEEMKRYWNEVSLSNASKAAEAQAAIKGEEEKIAEDLKTERVKIAEDILERFTHLSYMKYENGEAKGMDNAAIKKFVKKDMLSRSPKQLSRDILDRIIQNRGRLPRSYGKEIDGLLKKMGVGEGTPPATARDVLNAIDSTEYQKWAEERIPDMLGYAQKQGYYFDRLKFKPGQAEFLQRAYPAEFFEKAALAKTKYTDQAAKLMGGELSEFMDGGALNWKKIKEKLAGKDWTEGMKKLMKYTAYAGAGYVLGGGLMWQGGQYIGGQRVLNTLANLGRFGTATAGAVSRAGEWAINAPTVAATNLLQYPPINEVDAAGNVVKTTAEKFFPSVRTPDPSELVARVVIKP